MIREATPSDVDQLTELAVLLYPDSPVLELRAEFEFFTRSGAQTCFLAYPDDEAHPEAVGFTHVAMRTDYVEGTQTSPVGYLEAVYVREAYRLQGYGQRLVAASEEWARAKGAVEFASDCLLDNKDSYEFHMKCGFKEANRIISFTKDI